MRAAVNESYGPPEVVHVVDVPAPTAGPRDVLVRVHAAAVTAADARLRGARFPRGFAVLGRLALGVRRPRRQILGGVFSGVVEAVGEKVQGFAVGDEVCGSTGMRMGAHAELVAAPAAKVVRLPAGVSHEDAAAILFGGSTALHFLRDKAGVRPGQKVLVNGASGAIGTVAVQLARRYGATVTGVTSTPNLALVTDLGAQHVVDHTTTRVTDLTERFDVVLDTVGNLDAEAGRRLLTDDGVLILAVAGLAQVIRARGNVKAGPAPERSENFACLVGLLAAGRIRAVIEAVDDLDGIAAMHARVDSGHKVGNLVVRP